MAADPLIGRADTASAQVAVQELYEQYGPRVLAYCRGRLRSTEEAEDALQTTFLYAQRGLQRGVVPEVEVAWLLKIARNVCLAHWDADRRRRRLELVQDPGLIEAVSPAAATTQREEAAALETALGSLTDLQRSAILLREWRGLSYAEIARRARPEPGRRGDAHLPRPPRAREKPRPAGRRHALAARPLPRLQRPLRRAQVGARAGRQRQGGRNAGARGRRARRLHPRPAPAGADRRRRRPPRCSEPRPSSRFCSTRSPCRRCAPRPPSGGAASRSSSLGATAQARSPTARAQNAAAPPLQQITGGLGQTVQGLTQTVNGTVDDVTSPSSPRSWRPSRTSSTTSSARTEAACSRP